MATGAVSFRLPSLPMAPAEMREKLAHSCTRTPSGGIATSPTEQPKTRGRQGPICKRTWGCTHTHTRYPKEMHVGMHAHPRERRRQNSGWLFTSELACVGVRVEVPLACCRSDAPVGNAGRASQGGISVETTLRSFCCCSFLCATGKVPGGVSVTTHGSTDLQRFVVHNDAKMSQT